MNDIAKELGKLWLSELNKAEVVTRLMTEVTRRDLAEFVVDAYSRGWITNFNLGLDADGEPV